MLLAPTVDSIKPLYAVGSQFVKQKPCVARKYLFHLPGGILLSDQRAALAE